MSMATVSMIDPIVQRPHKLELLWSRWRNEKAQCRVQITTQRERIAVLTKEGQESDCSNDLFEAHLEPERRQLSKLTRRYTNVMIRGVILGIVTLVCLAQVRSSKRFDQ